MYRKKLVSSVLAGISLLVLTTCCLASDNGLMMATTTSTDNTGLLEYLIPHFEQETGIALK